MLGFKHIGPFRHSGGPVLAAIVLNCVRNRVLGIVVKNLNGASQSWAAAQTPRSVEIVETDGPAEQILYPMLRNSAPGQKWGYRTGFRPASNRGRFKISPPAGRRPAEGPILRFFHLESGRNPGRKPGFQPGSAIA